MAIKFNILNGTPKEGKSLCLSCNHGVHVKGSNCEEHTVCRAGCFGSSLVKTGHDLFQLIPGTVTFNVCECSQYIEKNALPLQTMKEIAWEIVARKRGSVGFADGADKLDPNELITEIRPPKRNEDEGTSAVRAL